jgi:hypothetical protein
MRSLVGKFAREKGGSSRDLAPTSVFRETAPRPLLGFERLGKSIRIHQRLALRDVNATDAAHDEKPFDARCFHTNRAALITASWPTRPSGLGLQKSLNCSRLGRE